MRRLFWSSCISFLCLSHYVQGVKGTGIPAFPILQRQEDTCGGTDLQQCKGDPNLPDNFCCPIDTHCYSLDNSSTALCCPDTTECSYIKPITCDISLQNATYDPQTMVKTTRLTDPLLKCANGCCPFGYSCTQAGGCRLIKEISKNLESTTVPVWGSTPTSSSSTSLSATSTGSSMTTTPTTSPVAIPGFGTSTNCPQFPAAAVVVGFFPGLACGVIVSIGWFFFTKRHAKGSSENVSPASTSPLSAHVRQRSDGHGVVPISEPIPTNVQDSVRTDFLRQQPVIRVTDEDSGSKMARTSARVRSFFGATKPPEPDPSTMPITPPNQVYQRHEPSKESIPIYSPRNLRPSRQQLHPNEASGSSRPPTTFTDMMERVGFQNGRGSPFYQVTDSPQDQPRKYRNKRPLKD